MFTLDAYAWALHSNGKHDAAREQMQLALEPGIRDARLRVIAFEKFLNRRVRAIGDVRLALEGAFEAPDTQKGTKSQSMTESPSLWRTRTTTSGFGTLPTDD